MSLAKNSLFSFTGKISQVVTVFLIGLIIARTIGPQGNGIYELFQLVVIFSVTLGTFGIGHSMVYLVKRKGYDIKETIATISTVAIFWGASLGLIVYFFYSLFPNIIDGLPESALLLGAIVIPFTLLDAYLIQAFLVELKIKKQSLLIILKNLLLIASIFVFVFILEFGEDGIIYAVSLAYVLSSLIVFYSLKKVYNFKQNFKKIIFKESFSFGIKNWLGNIFLILNYKLDMFLVNHYLGVEQVGLYSISVMIAASLFLIPSSIGPLLYSSWSSKEINDVDSQTPKIVRQILLIALIISLIAVAVSFFIIPIFYGEAFLPSFDALLFLLPGVIFMTANYVLFNNFASRGKPQYSAYTLIIALIVNIILNLILIPKMGINGAALSSTISYALSTLLSVLIFYTIKQVPTSKNILIATASDIKQLKDSIFNLFKKHNAN